MSSYLETDTISEEKTDYYLIKAVSNSSLSKLDPTMGGSPRSFINFIEGNEEAKYSLSLERGELLHKWMEDKTAFCVSEIDKPGGDLGKVIDKIFRSRKEYKSRLRNRILREAREFGYGGKTYTDNTIIEKFKTGLPYYKELLKGEGKIIITSEMKETLNNCIRSIESNKDCCTLLEENEFSSSLRFKEHPILWTKELPEFSLEVKCKSKIDLWKLDFDNRTIIVNDLKTTSSSLTLFQNSFEFYRYYRQLAFYKRAIISFILQQGILNEKQLSQFKWEFNLIVIETKPSFDCEIFRVSSAWIKKGQREAASLMNRYAWHSVNNIWDRQMEAYLNNYLVFEEPEL